MKDWFKNLLLKYHIKKFGSKNTGYFNHFVINWAKYKTFVLQLVNHENFLIRCWGRHKFRIDQDYESSARLISDILPHGYFLQNADGSRVFIVRTHCKYAKHLYYGFLLIWWMLHFLDWLIQKTWNPEFSFGFDTLTAYPDANPETNTVDGYSQRFLSSPNEESFSSIRSGEGTHSGDSLSTHYFCYLGAAEGVTDKYNNFVRGFVLFNTYNLGSGASIISAIFNFYSKLFNFDRNSSCVETVSMHLAEGNPSSNTSITSLDLQNVGSDSFGYVEESSIVLNQYNSITLNSSGVLAINKTGITKFSIQNGFDINNTEPTWATDLSVGSYFDSADQTGTSQDPKLVITYTTGESAIKNKNQQII
jgi:hypothetical protein